MHSNVVMQIEECFTKHLDDGEFSRSSRDHPYSIIPPCTFVSKLVFTTKVRTVTSALVDVPIPAGICILGRYGLPHATDVRWIRDLLGTGQLLFLGDLDPVDLLIYLWLKEHLHPHPITHLGISDSFIDACQLELSEVPPIRMSASEVESLPLVEKLATDMNEFVGARCTQLLKSGFKIEVEAVLGAADPRGTLLMGSICQSQQRNIDVTSGIDLNGTWHIVELEGAGRQEEQSDREAARSGSPEQLIIDGNIFRVMMPSGMLTSGEVYFSFAESPGHVDFVTSWKGEILGVQEGKWKLEDGVLYICFKRHSSERPAGFGPESSQENIVKLYKR